MEPEAGWGAAAAVAEADEAPLAPQENRELSSLAGFFQTLYEVLFRPGSFLRTWAGKDGPGRRPLPSSCPASGF